MLAVMAELADALDLGSSGGSRAGSSPVNRRFRIFVRKAKEAVFILSLLLIS